MISQVERIVDWVKEHGFERIALQFPDAMLSEAPELTSKVQQALPEKRIFILGDSSFGGGGVDEVGALHYGADCIVRFGHAEQQRGGDLPVLFVFGEEKDLESSSQIATIAHTISSAVANQSSTASCASFSKSCGHAWYVCVLCLKGWGPVPGSVVAGTPNFLRTFPTYW